MTRHRMTPKKRRITKHGNDRWEVDFGTDAVGKKIRLTLKTEAEADAEIDRYKKELKRCGEYWARLTELGRQTTVAILQEIQSKKLTLTRVWKEHQKWSKDVNKQETNTPMPYSDAVEEFKRRKLAAGKTERHVAEVADMLMKFSAGRPRPALPLFAPRRGRLFRSIAPPRSNYDAIHSPAPGPIGCWCWQGPGDRSAPGFRSFADTPGASRNPLHPGTGAKETVRRRTVAASSSRGRK